MLPPEPRVERLIFRWSAVAVFAGIALGLEQVYAEAGTAGLRTLGQLALISLAFLGKFVVFSGLRADTPTPWVLAMMVWLIDLVFAFALSSGLESLEHKPMLGHWLRRMRASALRVMRDYPGLERMAFFGVALFVMLPLAATGAISGSFAARITGLSRIAGVLAIALGSAVTALLFASLAQVLGDRAEDLARSPLLAGSAVLAFLLIGRATYVRVLGRLKKG